MDNLEEINVADMLVEQVYQRALEIEKLDVGSEERSRAVKDFKMLYDSLLDQQRIAYENEQAEKELDLKRGQAEKEDEFKQKQEKAKIWDRVILIATTVFTTLTPLGFGAWYFNRSIKFEEHGSYCATTSKNIINQFVNRIFKK